MGLVVGLDYRDARFSVHDALQELKGHPMVAKILEGGKRVGWGAKTHPVGRLLGAAAAAVGAGHGDRAATAPGMVNVPTLKGVHYAMHAGHVRRRGDLRAAEGGRRRATTSPTTQAKVEGSEIEKDIYRSRNMRQPFAKGFFVGGALANMMEISGGRFPGGRWATHDDATVDVFIGNGARLPEARRQGDVRQALVGLRHRQRHARRRAEPHPHPGEGAARGGADVAEHVPGAGVRGAGRGARGGLGRRQRQARRQARGRSCTSRPRTACSAGRSPPRAAG